MLRFGIDLGGTKIELCAFRSARVVHRERIATPAQDYGSIVGALAELVERAERALAERGSVGICTPGAISSKTGAIKNSNTACLNGRALDRDLAERLGREIRIENDANCFALSEAIDGAGAGAGVVFGVILGTGVGGGIVVRGRCLVGCNAIAGEWGHIALPYLDAEDLPAPECYCGRSGCVETYLCGKGLRQDFERRSGQRREAHEVAQLAAAGDAAAGAALGRYVDRLARGLSVVINVVDPDVIVLGGGLSLIDALYPGVVERLPRYVFSDAVQTKVVKAVHGDASGVRGAAWLWEA
ncbi:MAG TPA: ROK family protein [Polyangiales bacterium]|nr:ROK family protein [Polyangiales bacterium]